jgi:pyruvate dehydrogenase E2 component (dihydrolipoamide acetyltransferase)
MGEFLMPSLGADMEAGKIVEWRVAPGDTVHRGDIIAVVDTDKATIEVEVFEDGVVGQLLVEPGVEVAVGTPLATIGSGDASVVEAPAVEVPAVEVPAVEVPAVSAPAPAAVAHVVVSPLVRHIVEREGLDLARVSASGPGGRVLRRDVEQRRRRVSPRARRLAREMGVDLPPGDVVTGGAVLAAATASPSPSANPPPAKTDRSSSRRLAIARLMERSHREIPHYWVDLEIDVEDTLIELERANAGRPVRERILPAARLLRAVVAAAMAVPDLNGWWIDDAFVPASGVDLGLVVSLRGGGLVVPTIPRADTLDDAALMVALSGAVERARSDSLRSSDLATASISVTNLGDLGVDGVQPLIHPPEVAMVGFGAITERPVARGGLIGARRTVRATLAADHRASDGLRAATFLRAVADHLSRSAP